MKYLMNLKKMSLFLKRLYTNRLYPLPSLYKLYYTQKNQKVNADFGCKKAVANWLKTLTKQEKSSILIL